MIATALTLVSGVILFKIEVKPIIKDEYVDASIKSMNLKKSLKHMGKLGGRDVEKINLTVD